MARMEPLVFDVVVASRGAPSLPGMLASLEASQGPRPDRVVVVDARGRTGSSAGGAAPDPWDGTGPVFVPAGCATGAVAARDLGWRLGTAPWVVVLDERLRVSTDWLERLAEDVRAARPEDAIIRGDVRPGPDTDAAVSRYRALRALGDPGGARALGALDVAYRRSVLRTLGGFDRRLRDPRRAAADLADRARRRGLGVRDGRRRSSLEPMRPDRWALARWSASWAADALGLAIGARRSRLEPRARPAGGPAAVLFERDGTLIAGNSHDGDDRSVVPVMGARAALDRLRGAGIAVGLVSRRAGFSGGVGGAHADRMANRRVEDLLGPFDVVLSCADRAGFTCMSAHPRRGVVARAAALVSAEHSSIAYVGHVEENVVCAIAQAARGILVPNGSTTGTDLMLVPEVEPTIAGAVDLLLDPVGHRARVRRGPLADAIDRQSG